jgi:methionyl-tRNA synthetase
MEVIKTDEDRVRTILNILADCGTLEILIEPFLPFTADNLMKMLKLWWTHLGSCG